MIRPPTRLGDLVVFRVNGYRWAGFIAARYACPSCGRPVLMTSARVVLDDDDARALHPCDGRTG